MESFRLKFLTRLALQRFKPIKFFKKCEDILKNDNRRRAFIFLAADYGNLGDVAITYAQTRFLEQRTDYKVIEIPISQSLEGIWFVKKHIRKDDVITIVGGGNMGYLYNQIEFIRQTVIRFFPKNRIISFPQTIDADNTEDGLRYLRTAQKVYNQHINLHLIAREKTSYAVMKKNFYRANVYLCPDIVLSLNNTEPVVKRDGLIFCMRSDAEKLLSEREEKALREIAAPAFGSVRDFDTHIGRGNLSVEERVAELNKIWDAFRGAELVITDRLHGMIFCYITNTPCLVFQNNNHKIRETYQWIEHANVTLMNEFSETEIAEFIQEKRYQEKGFYQVMDGHYAILETLLT